MSKIIALASCLFITFALSPSALSATVNLKQGRTSYKLIDKKAQTNVLLLHGGAFSSWTWATTAPALAAKGYNVLRFDFYGMGKSEQLLIREYDRRVFFKQLVNLLKHVGWHNSKKPLYIIGSNIGASIGAMYVARYRRNVAKMILISPGYHIRETTGLFGRMATNWMNGFPDSRILRKKLKKEARKQVDEYLQRIPKGKRSLIERFVNKEFESNGYIDGLYRRLISNVFMSYSSSYRGIGRAKIPVLLLHGENDKELPQKHIRALKRRLRHKLTTVSYSGLGSEFTVINSSSVQKHIVDFLK